MKDSHRSNPQSQAPPAAQYPADDWESQKSSQASGAGKYWILAGFQRQSPLGWAVRYGLAVAAVAAAFVLRMALEAKFGSGLPTYITFYPAIMVVAVMAGFGPGMFATALTAITVTYWILPPTGQFTVAMPIDRLGLAIFTCMGLGMSVVAEFYRRNRDKAAAFDRDAAVRESRERLAVFAEATFEGIVESEAGRIVDCNEQLARMLGYSVEELKGMDISRLIAPEDRDRVMANILLGRDSVLEQTSLRKDGTRIVVEAHGRPAFPGSTRRYTTVRDITARKRYEEERETAAGFLRLVNESRGKEDLVRAAVTFFQEQSGCEAVGIRLKDNDDYPYYETRGFSHEFVRLESQLCTRDKSGAVVRDGEGYPICECMCGNVICGRFDPSKPFFTARGSFWTNCTTELLASTTEADRQTRTRNRCNGEGYESVALIALYVGADRLGLLQLNDRRKGRFTAERIALWERLAGYLAVALAKTLAEESLRLSEQRYRAIGESIDYGVWMCNPEGRNIYASDSFLKLVGITQQQCSDFGWGDVLHPDDAERTIAAWKECVRTSGIWDIEHRFRGVDGKWHTILARGVPVRDERGQIICWAGINLDISGLKRAEAALRESELRLRLAHQAARIGTFDWNLQNDVNLWSSELEAMYGLAPGEFGKTQPAWEQLVHPDDRAGAMAAVQRTFDTGEPAEGEWRVVWPDGSVHWVFGRFQAFKDQYGKPLRLTGVNFDITERKRAEESLRASREDLNRAQAVAQIGSWRLNVQRDELLWSDENWQIFGVPRGTPLSYETFLDTIHPDDRDYVHEKWSAALRGEFYDIEHRIVVSGQIKWVREKAELEFDDQGTLLGGFGTTQDITAKKLAEEALAAAKEAAEAANVAKTQFLTNMSHELRTPMNAILGMIDVALPKVIDPTVQDCLQTAKGSADLLLTLLNDLLDSAKIESGKLELESAPFSLRRMLDQVTRVLAVRASEKGLSFYCRVPDETPDAVIGDRLRLQQVLLNLAGNALKFTESGEVEIRLHTSELPSTFGRGVGGEGLSEKAAAVAISPHPNPLPEGEGTVYLEFTVRDTGIGIPSSSLENLFLPFAQADASMSRRFGGTGLGLSICKSLVEIMGGCIGVESEVGEGSTFHFNLQLPLAKELPADFDAPISIPTAACAPLRILLVEDNPANQKLATYILQDRGHWVEIAEDGEEAVHLTGQKRYDVILMDVQMPGMNGVDATAAIRKREIGSLRVPIIAMTAHAMKGDRDRCLAAGMDGYLSKPINVQEMLGLIENLVQRTAPTAEVATAIPVPKVTVPRTSAVVFNLEEAMKICFYSEDLLREMVQCFFNDVDALLPQMRAAFEKSDLEEVGRLAHRLKGTVVYIGAEPTKQAILRVEQFCKSSVGASAEVEEAINSLEQECLMLKAALRSQPLAADIEQCE